jgi:hypothetical protein
MFYFNNLFNSELHKLIIAELEKIEIAVGNSYLCFNALFRLNRFISGCLH